MTVLIAAAGEPGAVARERLHGAGFTVERVGRLADARVRAATVPVAVVGELADAPAAELRDALRTAGARTPLVALDAATADGWAETVAGADDPALPEAVRVARHAGAYRDAVDELFERARDGEDVDEALREANEAFTEVRRAAGGTPFDRLLDE